MNSRKKGGKRSCTGIKRGKFLSRGGRKGGGTRAQGGEDLRCLTLLSAEKENGGGRGGGGCSIYFEKKCLLAFNPWGEECLFQKRKSSLVSSSYRPVSPENGQLPLL